jgi:hypothetical protein
MKTAVEWLESEMLENYSPFDNKLLYEAIHKAKEMEKEQIKNAWYNSLTKGDYHSGDEYYNETFKQQNNDKG